jgi:hypothetical protein
MSDRFTDEERAELRRQSEGLNRAMSVDLDRVLRRMGYPGIVEEGIGYADHTLWQARDGWIVGYTTGRIERGSLAGRFATLVYKPTGKGARSGDPHEWQLVETIPAATRKTAKARAEARYRRHDEKP